MGAPRVAGGAGDHRKRKRLLLLLKADSYNNNNKLRPHLPDTTPVGYCSAGKAGDRTPA